MSNGAQFIVLAEDAQAAAFVRLALLRRGANPRRIRVLPHASTGAGDAYVLKRYADEVRAARSRNARTSTGLLVHVDADTLSVDQRHEQLAERLKGAHLPPRTNDEPVVELVPRRNIETWLHALDDALAPELARPLDERVSYPKSLEYLRGCAKAAEAFASHAKANTRPSSAAEVPSLTDGIREFQRLP